MISSRKMSSSSRRMFQNFRIRPTNSSFFQFSIRNSQTKFAQRGVCFVLIPLFLSAPFNRLRIHLFFQFSKPIPDFQFSKRSRNHEINRQKEGVLFDDFDQRQKQCVKTNTAQRRARSALWGRKRDAKLDAARPNRDRIGSACHIDHGIRRHSGRNSANYRAGH